MFVASQRDNCTDLLAVSESSCEQSKLTKVCSLYNNDYSHDIILTVKLFNLVLYVWQMHKCIRACDYVNVF